MFVHIDVKSNEDAVSKKNGTASPDHVNYILTMYEYEKKRFLKKKYC